MRMMKVGTKVYINDPYAENPKEVFTVTERFVTTDGQNGIYTLVSDEDGMKFQVSSCAVVRVK